MIFEYVDADPEMIAELIEGMAPALKSLADK